MNIKQYSNSIKQKMKASAFASGHPDASKRQEGWEKAEVPSQKPVNQNTVNMALETQKASSMNIIHSSSTSVKNDKCSTSVPQKSHSLEMSSLVTPKTIPVINLI